MRGLVLEGNIRRIIGKNTLKENERINWYIRQFNRETLCVNHAKPVIAIKPILMGTMKIILSRST